MKKISGVYKITNTITGHRIKHLGWKIPKLK